MKRLTGQLYFWVLLAIVAGGTLGYFDAAAAVTLKPLGDGFIALVKMLISPVIFCTVVLGICGAGDMKKVGRVGGKALLYFEIVSTIALVIGLMVMNFIRPGDGFNIDPRQGRSQLRQGGDRTEYRGFYSSHYPEDLHRRFHRFRRFATGSTGRNTFRLLHHASGQSRTTDPPLYRRMLAHFLRHDEYHHESGTVGCRGGHGLYHREIRHWCTQAAGNADGQLLPDLFVIHIHCSRHYRSTRRL